MERQKNLHANISGALLKQIERAAAEEHLSVDEFVQRAVTSYLNRREWDEVLMFGERHAKARNLTEHDIEEAIAAVRSENQIRGR